MYVKASGLFVMGTKIYGYVCQRVEEGRGIMEDGERGGGVRTSSLPDSTAGRAATLAASLEWCRYGNMRGVDEKMCMRDREMKLDNTKRKELL